MWNISGLPKKWSFIIKDCYMYIAGSQCIQVRIRKHQQGSLFLSQIRNTINIHAVYV